MGGVNVPGRISVKRVLGGTVVSFVVLLAGAWQAAVAEACAPTPSPPPAIVDVFGAPTLKYSPNHPRIQQHQQVLWSFIGSTMTATDSTGMGLFNSGAKSGSSANPSYKFAFEAAGSFPFHSTNQPSVKGIVSVNLRRTPGSGHLSTTFSIGVACAVRTGFVSDVVIRPPGGNWGWWRYGVTTTTVGFRPTKTGTYQFRSRLRRTSNNTFSLFSPLVLVGVH